MANSKQKTGGQVMGGPGMKAGLKPRIHKAAIPNKGGYSISPNSSSRGKQGNK